MTLIQAIFKAQPTQFGTDCNSEKINYNACIVDLLPHIKTAATFNVINIYNTTPQIMLL